MCAKILVYFTKISRTAGHVGGSEMLLFLIIKELQERGYDITVALQSGGDIVAGAKDYGVVIDAEKVRVVHLGECGRLLRFIDRHLKFLWQWRLRHIGPHFNICISCANPVDFGRPGIHFVYMLTLDEKFKAHFWRAGEGGWMALRTRLVYARDAVVAFFAGVRMPAKIVRDPQEVVLANSNYAKSCIEAYYKCRIHDAFYPPTVFEQSGNDMENRCGYDIAYIGRFEPEKRVENLIEIVRCARELSGIDFRLHLAGRCPDTAQGDGIREKIARYKWANHEGTVKGDAKVRFLASCRFALHGCKVEAFGISVTEYLKAGLVPVVPVEGGSSEVVGLEELEYSDDAEAARILVRLVRDRDFYERCSKHCRERAVAFSADAYTKRQKKLFDEYEI